MSRLLPFEAFSAPARQAVYDWQDAVYFPFAGFEGVTRPGPNLRVYRRVRSLARQAVSASRSAAAATLSRALMRRCANSRELVDGSRAEPRAPPSSRRLGPDLVAVFGPTRALDDDFDREFRFFFGQAARDPEIGLPPFEIVILGRGVPNPRRGTVDIDLCALPAGGLIEQATEDHARVLRIDGDFEGAARAIYISGERVLFRVVAERKTAPRADPTLSARHSNSHVS